MITKHQYRDMTPDQQEELFSNYLFDSWSFSKLSTFTRNEKAFEMSYIYRINGKSSATEVSGSAYHSALEFYFSQKKLGLKEDIVTIQTVAYDYIDSVEPNRWKLQKTTPTIEECRLKANKTVSALLKNFFEELDTYEGEIEEILEVELYCDEFLVINGVEVPLPCHAKIDLVVRTNAGKIVIIDHKSKTSFSDEQEVRFTLGKQAITYVKCFEEKFDLTVDEVWFVENKSGENRDKSQQIIPFKVLLDKNTRKLYELMLYESLKRMLEAISDPDYIYLINESDNFIDKAELYEFWAQTMIAEVGDFNIPENKQELITRRLKKVRDVSMANVDPKTIKKFRENASEFIQYDLSNKNMTKEEKIEHCLRVLGIIVKVEHTFSGYSSDTFLMRISGATNIASVQRYKLDIASALDVSNVRITKDLFVYEGKSYLAIESGKNRESNLLFDPKYLTSNRIPLGLDNFNNKIFWDLDNPSTPHMLICGSTGSGKSICIISILEYAKLAGMDQIVIFDPKHEFKDYNGGIVEVHNDIEDIETMMELMVEKMNTLVKRGQKSRTLIIFDEFADAVANSRKGPALDVYKTITTGTFKNGMPKTKRVKTHTKNSLEENLRILLQKGRSSGFRIIAATQRASVKVITGDAKVNLTVQICFRVEKEVDSKVVIDEGGAEGLLGKGDGLIKSPEFNGVTRFQAFFNPSWVK